MSEKPNTNNSHLLADSLKTELGALDIFDKVINLKLTTTDAKGNVQDVYVIRSDFEVYYPELARTITMADVSSFQALHNGYARKCQYKPSIKVQLKRVSLVSATEIDIYIHNFYALSKNGEMIQNFNNADNRLSKVEIAMGYYGQFASIFKDKGGVPQNTQQFSDFGFREQDTAFGINVIKASNVEYVTIDKLPPDSLMHIHCYVGNYLSAKLNDKAEDFPDNYEDITKSNLIVKASGDGDFLKKIYFECVTKNWLKFGALSKAEEAKIEAQGDMVIGTLSDSDAKKYGIPVYLSKGVMELSKQLETTFSKKDKNGNIVFQRVTIGKANTAEGKMNAIEGSNLHLDGVIHTPAFDGYIVFKREELSDIESLLDNIEVSSNYKETAFAKYWSNNIPAVYDITKNAYVTIVCPFFCYLEPFETLYFKSRYALSGLVQYFSNMQAQRMAFRSLWMNLSFATKENINECIIVCVSEE